jgi:cell wall-active antibiotic response 4TMS protein YvqF/B-box zinc finger protein
MNCANHPQSPVAAYCRTCGKPLCTACTRPVMGVVYCETCLAERVGATVPPQTNPYPQSGSFQSTGSYTAGTIPPRTPRTSGPNPGLAGLLGAIPFGVGAIYNGQYTKGLVHLGIFVALVVALSSNLADYWYIILGIGMGFFVVYQILDAIHTARAIQAGRPAPDPFGLTTAFSPGQVSPGQPRDFAKNVPTGAVVLIALGVLFLLHNLGWWFLRADVLGPLVMIAIGVWLLARRLGSPGGIAGCGARGLMGPAVLMTIGAQFLLNNLDIISFGRTLPVLLIVIGIVLAVQRTAHHSGDIYPPPAAPGSGGAEAPSPTEENPVPPSEVKNG